MKVEKVKLRDLHASNTLCCAAFLLWGRKKSFPNSVLPSKNLSYVFTLMTGLRNVKLEDYKVSDLYSLFSVLSPCTSGAEFL
jgi:hypothetical protein